MRHLIGFVHRVVYAALLTLCSWLTCTSPVGAHAAVQKLTCEVLDWPIAAAGVVVRHWRGVDVFYGGGGCEFCPPKEFFWSHLRFGILVYVVLFYVPSVVILIARRWRLKVNHDRVTGAERQGNA